MKKIRHYIDVVSKLFKEEKIQPIYIAKDKEKLLEGKIALITGGSSGIGLEIAKTFMGSGAKVIITGQNEEKLNYAIDSLNFVEAEKAKGMVLDIRNIRNMKHNLKEVIEMFEEKKIDILVNSAGVTSKHDFFDIDEDEYDKIMDTNLKGTFFISQYIAKHMIDNHIKGHILNISSSSALRPAWTPYQISKWGVRGLTLGMADKLLPYGIVVNAIAPGATATPLLGFNDGNSISLSSAPSSRYVMPKEVASLALFMVSGQGDMIIGDSIYMTGGSGTITLHN